MWHVLLSSTRHTLLCTKYTHFKINFPSSTSHCTAKTFLALASSQVSDLQGQRGVEFYMPRLTINGLRGLVRVEALHGAALNQLQAVGLIQAKDANTEARNVNAEKA